MARRRPLKLVSLVEAEREGRTIVDQQHDAPMVRGDTGGLDYACGACGAVLVEHSPDHSTVEYDDVLLRCRCGALNSSPARRA